MAAAKTRSGKYQSKSAFQRWLKATTSGLKWNWRHQRLLYEKLHLITTGKCRRLMIFMPPRHAKSETVTIRYLAWRLECDPTLNIILGSYNQKLANRFSRRIRRIVEERVTLAKDHKAVDEWETTAGGGVRAVGVGAGITGFGGSLIVIDDPVKNRAEAESLTRRDNAWEWFNDDILTRLEPRSAVIVIQTRWHEDDLSGRIIERLKKDGEAWEIVSLPALAEADDQLGRAEGEALWPQRFDEKYLDDMRRQLGTYSFSALYQQKPVPKDGGTFKRRWFDGKIIDRAPAGLRWCRGYDLAVSTKTSADYTASFRCAQDRAGTLYIADGFRQRIEFPEQRKYIVERIKTETDTSHGIEAALHGLAFVQELRRDRQLVNRAFQAVKVDNDKFTRALGWANRAEEGKVYLVRGAWIDEFLDEVCVFPGGAHDDQVDAVSLAVQMMPKDKKGLFTF